MSPTILRIGGVNFDAIPICAQITIKPYEVFTKGQIVHNKAKDHSGVKFDVSKREPDDVAGQIEDAIHFLKTHKQELQQLANTIGVDYIYLDFGFEYKMETFAHYRHLPPELVQLAGSIGIGIEISCYGHKREDE